MRGQVTGVVRHTKKKGGCKELGLGDNFREEKKATGFQSLDKI